MFETLEDRQFMSVTLLSTATTSITDGTSNIVVFGEATADKKAPTRPKAGAAQQTYLTVTLSNVLISSY